MLIISSNIVQDKNKLFTHILVLTIQRQLTMEVLIFKDFSLKTIGTTV